LQVTGHADFWHPTASRTGVPEELITEVEAASPHSAGDDAFYLIGLLLGNADKTRRLAEAIGRNTEVMVTAGVSKLCACGCGRLVTSARPEAKYATGACRVRAHRAKTEAGS
jgi:hypothetical protein